MRQIVPDAALDDPVHIFAREFPSIGAGLRVRCPIGITLQRNRGNGNVRGLGQPLFQIIVLRLSFSQSEPPAIIVDHDDLTQI